MHAILFYKIHLLGGEMSNKKHIWITFTEKQM